jgi:hypothetical protein
MLWWYPLFHQASPVKIWSESFEFMSFDERWQSSRGISDPFGEASARLFIQVQDRFALFNKWHKDDEGAGLLKDAEVVEFEGLESKVYYKEF